VNPALTNSQAESILEHTADDVERQPTAARSADCSATRSAAGDASTSRRRSRRSPARCRQPDKDETNDDAGTQAWTLWGKQVTVTATVDYYDDQVDVYRIALSGGERVAAS